MRARWQLVLGLLLAMAGAGAVRAHNEEVLSVTVTNYTGYLIASDANAGLGPEYNRENIAAQTQIRFTAATTTATDLLLPDPVPARRQRRHTWCPVFDENGQSATRCTG
jgi:hypothetical protein